MSRPATLLFFCIAALACAAPGSEPAGATPGGAVIGTRLPGTHAHNDFERSRPLFHALERGLASIEVDVALRDGRLYVTHDTSKIRTDRTLQAEYLDPLRDLAEANGGRVYEASQPPLQLLIDVKSDAAETHSALHALLAEYDPILTRWTGTDARPGPVSVIVSGNRAIGPIGDEAVRYMAVDGRIYDDRDAVSEALMPLVSINWDDTIGRGGRWLLGERLENAERFIAQVHGEGRQVRFWGTPDREDLWRRLEAVGVDYIGADSVDDLHRFAQRRAELR